MAGQQQEQQPQIEKSFDLFNPGGDPSVLRACAEAWRGMAHDLKSTVETQDHEVVRLGDNWTGAAADAFHAHWNHAKGQVEKALPHFETVAQQLDHTADAIQKANDEVHRVAEEIAATVAIGIGLTVLTGGFSDAVAAGAAAAEVAEAAGEVTRLGQLLIRVAEVMEKIRTAMNSSKLLKFGFEFGKSMDANFIGNVGGQWATGQKITWGQDLQDAAVAGLAGTAVSEGAGKVGEKVEEWAKSSGKHGAAWAWSGVGSRRGHRRGIGWQERAGQNVCGRHGQCGRAGRCGRRGHVGRAGQGLLAGCGLQRRGRSSWRCREPRGGRDQQRRRQSPHDQPGRDPRLAAGPRGRRHLRHRQRCQL
ncbi:WXG100 family type VII secretion target [Streptomyces noursei]|uniref:WXG100 family type VII secretion target n=1 Tax=Streptomyces noursei TaxID=1971 RepID=UPI00381059F3